MALWKKLIIPIIILLVSIAVVKWINYVDVESYYKGKRILLTGASYGIGKDLAIRLSQLGARLVIAARNVSKLKDTQTLCQKYSQDVFTVQADVTKEEDNKLLVSETVKHLGGIDILLLNAGYSPPFKAFVDRDDPAELFLYVYKVNVLQGVYLTKFAIDHLRESHGTILAVSSLAGWLGAPFVTPYSASKHALHGYFSSLNMEFQLRQENVSVVIMPLPFVHTARSIGNLKPKKGLMFEPGIPSKECVERMLKGLPLKNLYYYVTWDGFIIGHLYSLCPYCFDYAITIFGKMFSETYEKL
ncbi:hydroxysteroid 11-beta-dehydrogenase 1-like protein A [Dysidea avara]|uniref:hydroxysteroid 11-beta-dehydrogenase 1-like protein A n=1 Tax=Dysidea avara TaxID=196820 RepID=UPI00331F3B3B